MAVAATIFLFLLLASPMAFAKEHIVGGSNGWSQSVDYSSWASGETFNVGDTLGKFVIFIYLFFFFFWKGITYFF